MPLIQCKECGKEYSDMSSVCINCGCPTEYNTKLNKEASLENKQNMFVQKTHKQKKLILAAIIIVSVFTIFIIIKLSDMTTDNVNGSFAVQNDANIVTNKAISLALQIGTFSGNYTGVIKDDLPEGEGMFSSAEGWSYDGEWKNGHFKGNGKRIADHGQIEEGIYENDLLNGNGNYKDPSGFEYSGAFKNGVFDGDGSMKFPYTGTGFQGEFTNGTPDETFKYVCSPISMVAIPYNILQYENIFGQAVTLGGHTMPLLPGEERARYSGGDLLSLKSSDGDKYYIVSIAQGAYCVVALDANVSLNVGQLTKFYGISIGTYDMGDEEYPLIKAYYYDYL